MLMLVATAVLLSAAAVQDKPAAPPNPPPNPQAEAKSQPTPAGPLNFEVGGNRIGLYGILRMDAYYGTGRFNHDQFTYYAVSTAPTVTPAVNDHRNWIDLTPRLSRLGVKVDRD